ncbi:MAG TPA: hypothetical protein ENI23_06880 [bacterium]|nr:hypothetical protein [bacterium]
MDDPDNQNTLTSFESEKILEALRKGVVPIHHLQRFSVGRNFWLDSIKSDLDFVRQGASKVRFLSAPYGGGKTHFLSLIKEEALKNRYVVSYVELHSREAPMDRFEIIFPKIMRGIVVSEDNKGLEHIFETWVNSFHFYSQDEIEKNLREIASSLDFRAALRSYLGFAGTKSPDHQEYMRAILGWLGGSKLPSQLVVRTGIRNTISISNVSEIMGSFLQFIRSIGFAGLLLLFDEAEVVTSLTQSRKRAEANQNIRKMLDNADNYLGLYIIFATTPQFMEDPTRGARSYPALWERIKDVINLNLQRLNRRSIIIPLLPLGEKELQKLAERIIETHGKAYNWEASKQFSEKAKDSYVQSFQQRDKQKLARHFIRVLVALLDTLEQMGDEIHLEKEIQNLTFEEL